MSALQLKIEKQLSVSPETVFDAWTTPSHMAAWYNPMGESEIPQHDLRVGGTYQIDMKGEGAVYVHQGKFVEIDRPHKLVFTWISDGTGQKETLVTLQFKANEKGTLLTLIHENFGDEEMVKSHTGGWTMILEKLDKASAGS